MTKEEKYKNAIVKLHDTVASVANFEPVDDVFGVTTKTVFEYRYVEGAIITKYLQGIGRCAKWTWFDDLAASEWFVTHRRDADAVINTCRHALKYWRDNASCMAEFLFALAMKCNEHYERKNENWQEYYDKLYHYCLDFIYDYYEGDTKSIRVVWEYLD